MISKLYRFGAIDDAAAQNDDAAAQNKANKKRRGSPVATAEFHG